MNNIASPVETYNVNSVLGDLIKGQVKKEYYLKSTDYIEDNKVYTLEDLTMFTIEVTFLNDTFTLKYKI